MAYKRFVFSQTHSLSLCFHIASSLTLDIGSLDAELVVTPALPPDFHITLHTRDTPDGESTIIEVKMGSHPPPKIILYTSYACPWAHRSQIALAELRLEFETVLIDLTVPRTPEYLAINPRGLVPALSYNGEILTESGVISQFLVDAHPSHLEKTSREEGGALQRARYNFFIETYFSKVAPHVIKAGVGKTEEEREQGATRTIDAIVKEIEPSVQNAAPFFGGSERLTFVEVSTYSSGNATSTNEIQRYKLDRSCFDWWLSLSVMACYLRVS